MLRMLDARVPTVPTGGGRVEVPDRLSGDRATSFSRTATK